MRSVVVNLFAGPGVGKSTTAARVFTELKMRDVNCEMALEFAKEKVWEESFRTMDDQIYIFGKQLHKIWRLKDKVDVIICDSPLPISILYDKENSQAFHTLIMEQFNKFDNLNYFIERNTKYEESGRRQSEAEARELDTILEKILLEKKVDFKKVKIDEATDTIVADVLEKLRYGRKDC